MEQIDFHPLELVQGRFFVFRAAGFPTGRPVAEGPGAVGKWRVDLDPNDMIQEQDHAACSLDASYVLTWEEIANLAAESGKPAET